MQCCYGEQQPQAPVAHVKACSWGTALLEIPLDLKLYVAPPPLAFLIPEHPQGPLRSLWCIHVPK